MEEQLIKFESLGDIPKDGLYLIKGDDIETEQYIIVEYYNRDSYVLIQTRTHYGNKTKSMIIDKSRPLFEEEALDIYNGWVCILQKSGYKRLL